VRNQANNSSYDSQDTEHEENSENVKERVCIRILGTYDCKSRQVDKKESRRNLEPSLG